MRETNWVGTVSGGHSWRERSVLYTWKRILLIHGIKVWFIVFLHGKLFVRLWKTTHIFLQVGFAPKEKFVIITAAVRTGTDASKAPGIHQSIERMVVAVLEKERHHQGLKEIRFQYLPRSSMGHPGDDILKLLLGQNGVQFDGKLLDTNRRLHGAAVRRSRRRSRTGLPFKFFFRDVGEIAVVIHGRSIAGFWNRSSLLVRNDCGERSHGLNRLVAGLLACSFIFFIVIVVTFDGFRLLFFLLLLGLTGRRGVFRNGGRRSRIAGV
mmetsp:Transcript_18026/g.29130  ORF Transcript_18026/g.29130 Transcript_18026/m.29130 type:complete len:266 (+) Transcript_18026:182-979(+)